MGGGGVRVWTSCAGGVGSGVGGQRPPARSPTSRGCSDVNFVRSWSGGPNGTFLSELEKFERSLETKREISQDDMQAMSQLQFTEGPVFVLALCEAQLSSPPRYSTPMGESTLMTPADYKEIGPNGKRRAKAVRAARIMMSAREFSDAYSHVDNVKRLKHMSTLDCRLVMMARGSQRGIRDGGLSERIGG